MQTALQSDAGSISDRVAKRHKVFLVTELIDTVEVQRAHVLDVSTSGALLHCEGTVRNDRPASVRLDDHMHPIAIVSINSQRIGVRFITDLTEEEVSGLIAD
jgi:hypothetical protein